MPETGISHSLAYGYLNEHIFNLKIFPLSFSIGAKTAIRTREMWTDRLVVIINRYGNETLCNLISISKTTMSKNSNVLFPLP